MEYLVIGSGVAGISGAAAIRQRDSGGRITILTEEAYPFYSRIRLPDFLAGRVSQEALQLKKESWYREQRIDLRLEQQVAALDVAAGSVRTLAGASFPFDRLLLATGGVSFVPPVAGAGKEGVFTLRTLGDAIRIRAHAATAKRVVVIGGGVLGLEAGNGLRLAGCQVTVIEFFDRLLPRQTDPVGSALLKARLEGMGFAFVLPARVEQILGEERVSGLRLADGRELACDLVIIAAGVRANLGLAREAGLAVDRGVLVDDRMCTSHPQIFAAGDLVQHRDTTYGIWPAAQEQGEVAGANLAGDDLRFTGMVPSNLLKVAGIDLFAMGDIDGEGRREQAAIVNLDEERAVYWKLVLDERERLIGAILFGDLSHRRRLVAAIDEVRAVSPGLRAALQEGHLERL